MLKLHALHRLWQLIHTLYTVEAEIGRGCVIVERVTRTILSSMIAM